MAHRRALAPRTARPSPKPARAWLADSRRASLGDGVSALRPRRGDGSRARRAGSSRSRRGRATGRAGAADRDTSRWPLPHSRRRSGNGSRPRRAQPLGALGLRCAAARDSARHGSRRHHRRGEGQPLRSRRRSRRPPRRGAGGRLRPLRCPAVARPSCAQASHATGSDGPHDDRRLRQALAATCQAEVVRPYPLRLP